MSVKKRAVEKAVGSWRCYEKDGENEKKLTGKEYHTEEDERTKGK